MKNINIKIFLIIIVGSLYPLSSSASNNFGEWKPQIVEKMFVLPPEHLNKVLNNDFDKSILAVNLRNTNKKIKTNIENIKDLNLLLSGKTDEETMEIKHQIILHKRDYVKDMSNLLIMKKQRLNIKKTFFNKIVKNINVKSFKNKTKNKFFKNQNIALQRSQKLDIKILADTSINLSKKSKYFDQYQINKDAVRQLQSAIEKHPMNTQDILSKNPKNKIEAVRNYLHNLDTEIAVLEMKEQMINYMAKIVALDAMNLAENVAFTLNGQGNKKSNNFNDPVNAISVFTN